MGEFAFGLLGSGEFEPWSGEVDRWLLDRAAAAGRDGRVLILPTASAAEGDDVFDGWAAMGLEHFGGLEVDAEVVALKTREDAGRTEFVALLDRASVAYFSGGNPAYLASVLAGSPFWEALMAAMKTGLAYTGCSAGVAALGETAPDSASRDPEGIFGRQGLRLFPDVDFGPHWDALDSYMPGLRQMILDRVPPGRRLLGIDERTAVVGDGRAWRVVGVGAAHLYMDGSERSLPSGVSFDDPWLEGGEGT